jgi:membrane protein
MNFLYRIFHECWHRFRYLMSRFTADRCSENAAALTYMSLFALVPLLTVLYTMASALPAFQGVEARMQSILFENLMPESSSDIEQYLNDFSTQAKTLTGPGIAFLLITAILMLRNIEKAFNMIWRAREHRNPLSSFLLYWAVLTLAPISIGVALGLSTYLASFTHALGVLDVFGARGYLLKAVPFLFSTAGFSLVYAAVPNCRVPFKHALIGGVIASLAFHVARSIFTDLVVGSSITFIYGAFAAVPLFLLWIYLSWNIVLMGGILVHSLSAYQSDEQASRPMVLKALDVLYLFWQKQKSGATVREIELLDNRHSVVRGLDSESWGELRDILTDKKVITQNEKGHYLLCRDLHTVPFWQLKEWVNDEQTLNRQDLQADLNWQDEAYRLLQNQRSDQRDILGVDLVEIFSK